MNKYHFDRTCEDCGHTDYKALCRQDAAFEERWGLWDFWNSTCTACGSTACSSSGCPSVDIDQELLDEWGQDKGLSFMLQDEHLIMTDMDNLSLITQAIDQNKYLPYKMKILAESLCMLLYDNAYPSDEFSEAEDRDRKADADMILPELIKRKDFILQHDEFMFDYIKEVVYPLIGAPL